MFDEMVQWATDATVDFIIGETFYFAEEAFCALEAIQDAQNVPAVITIAPMGENKMRDGWSVIDTLKALEDRGAHVVGLNCFRGPETMMPFLQQARHVLNGPMAALPVPYRTHAKQPTFFNLDDNNGCSCPSPHGRTFPTALDPLMCNRYEIRQFAADAWKMDIRYLGVCCGAAPIHIREVAEAIGRTPAASRYAENMSKHFMYGNDERIPGHMAAYGELA